MLSSSTLSFSSSSSFSSHDSSYFTAFLSPSSKENPYGQENTPMDSSSLSSSLPSSCRSCSSSQSSSSNPSPSSGENTHLVFISFRGVDTRRGFVSYLHDALGRNGIRAYMDDRDIKRGNKISSTLLKAINQSKISLVVFSKNYASSSWTMEELVEIMNCHKTKGQLFLPIFYEISPSEVRKKRSPSTVLTFWSSCMTETEQRWATAMKEAAGLAGWESSNYRTESELVEVIVNEVKEHLESMRHTSRDHGLSSSHNSSPDEPNSGGSSHNNRDDDDPMPQDSSSTRKCLSNGTLNLLGYLLWRTEHERLVLKSRGPHDQPLNLDTSRSYVHRNRYKLKQQQRWWGIQRENIQQ